MALACAPGGLSVSVIHAAPGLDWIDQDTNLTFYGDLRIPPQRVEQSVANACIPKAHLVTPFGFAFGDE